MADGRVPLGVTAANTAALTADNTCQLWTTVEYRPSARTAVDGPGRCAHYYGSEGRARRVPDQAVDRGSSRSLRDSTASIATCFDAREPSRGGDLTRKRSAAWRKCEIVTLGQVLHLLVVDPHQGPDLLAEHGTYDAEPLGDESGPGGQPDELIAGPDA